MPDAIALTGSDAIADLRTLLGRAVRLDAGAVRLVAMGAAVAVTVPVLVPRGLLSTAPTVLGVRAFAERSGAVLDRVLPPRALLDRLARPRELGEGGAVSVPLPDGDEHAEWAGIAPPRAGWRRVGVLDVEALRLAAAGGIAAVRDALPEQPGDAVVGQVRERVWASSLDDARRVPLGAAFAADALGVLGAAGGGGEATLTEAPGGWCRLALGRGDVLVRGRPSG